MPSIYNNNLNIRRIFIFLQLRLFQLLFIVNISLFILQTPLILTSISEKIKNKNHQIINNEENNIFINFTKLKNKNKFSRSVRLLDKNEKEIKKYPLIVGAGEKLNIPIKGGTVPVEWFNLRIVDPQRFGRRLGDLRFEVNY